MTKYYTAVGRFMNPTTVYGKLNPTLSVGGVEYLLDYQELIIWSSLFWRFLKYEEIGKYYEKKTAEYGYANERSWESCLDRLVVRGLVVFGTGETDYDALYNLISPLYIIPLTGNLPARAISYMKLTCIHRIPKNQVSPILQRDKKTKKEKQLLKLTQQVALTVGELVRCIDKGIRNLDNEDSVMDEIYDDESLTSDNIGESVKYTLCCQDVTITVANLYMRQQLIFDRA